MKKIYAFVGMGLLIGSSAFAQQLGNRNNVTSQFISKPSVDPAEPAKSATGAGDTIRYYDFSNPSDYVMYSEADSPAEEQWQVGSASDIAKQYMGEINSATKDNGYAWCTGLDVLIEYVNSSTPYNEINTSIEMAQAFDFSAVSAASIIFTQRHRAFNSDHCFIEYSIDGGSTWPYSTEINTTASVNTYSVTAINMLIPSEVMGNNNVKLRFRWMAETRAPQYQYGAGYGWQVDDLIIVQSPAKALSLSEVHVDNGLETQRFEYGEQPASQSHTLNPYVNVRNDGGASQDVTVTLTVEKDGAFYGTYSNTPAITIASGEDSTFTFPAFVSSEMGNYTFSFTVAGSTPDEEFDPANNTMIDSLWITNGTWGDKQSQTFKGRSYAFDKDGDPESGSVPAKVAQAFEVLNSGDKAYSITTVFPQTASSGTGTFSPDQPIYIELFKYTGDYTESYIDPANLTSVAAMPEYVISAEDISTGTGADAIYKTISFTTPVDLTTGIHLISIEALGGDYRYVFAMGASTNRDGSGSFMGSIGSTAPSDQYVKFNDVTPWIKLNLSGPDAVSENNANNFVLGQNQPNPFNGGSVINYELKEAGKVSFEVMDVTGKVVKAIEQGTQAAGAYKINLNAAEFGAGVYFYSINVNGAKVSKKMIITE